MDPLLSIVIPSFNYARYLPHTLDSILSQDFKNFEVILIDDGSTDESHVISEKYAARDVRIQYKRHEKNRGLFVVAEEGMDAARGKYIHFLGADDLYLPQFLSKLMHPLVNNPKVGMACCDLGYFQDGSSLIEIKPVLKGQKTPTFYSPEELITLFQKTDFWIPGAVCIAKKELVLKYDGLIPSLENLADWFLYHRVALSEGMAYIPENLMAMRVHDQTYTKQVKKNKKRRRAAYWALLKTLDKHKECREKFKKAALLSFIFRDLSWRVRLKPKYWDFLPYISKKNRLRQ